MGIVARQGCRHLRERLRPLRAILADPYRDLVGRSTLSAATGRSGVKCRFITLSAQIFSRFTLQLLPRFIIGDGDRRIWQFELVYIAPNGVGYILVAQLGSKRLPAFFQLLPIIRGIQSPAPSEVCAQCKAT